MGLRFAGDWLPKRAFDAGAIPAGALAVGNLECAFADGEIESGKAYTAVLPRSCLGNVGSGGFAALSVANNHVCDAGNFDDTYGELTRRFPAIQFFGTIEKPYAELVADGCRVFVIGCLEPCRSRGRRIFREEDVLPLIRRLRQSGETESPGNHKILVYPHWGMEGEYTRYPSPRQQKLARSWIDAGADGVLGSHSHVPQGREYYKGKPIYYSLGNFDFDHPESKLYEGTGDRMTVSIDAADMLVEESFSSDGARETVEKASAALADWNTWRWAKAVGPFNVRKNMASWGLRLSKPMGLKAKLVTIAKFIVWQFLPQTILFRIAGLCR